MLVNMDHFNKPVRSPFGIISITAGSASGLECHPRSPASPARALASLPAIPAPELLSPLHWFPARRTHRRVDTVHINKPVRSPSRIIGTMVGPAPRLGGAKMNAASPAR